MKYSSQTHSDVAAACADALKRPGAVVLLPTETVYGLVCRWDDAAARERIYALKHRCKNKLLAMFAPDMASAERYGAVVSDLGRRLFERFTPGGITVICRDRSGGTVGVRVPDHPLVLAVLKLLGEPLASTSANLSGTPAALDCATGLAGLDGEVELAIDGGALPADSLASTVVDATGDAPKILREGAIPSAVILA
ncbi:MAG: L-threonylcarbamoyladenylate synthase [Victivallaceae bacterium]|nr:L-threonylcarbamoyladenylate synthase [Victivallaceae bacterium]